MKLRWYQSCVRRYPENWMYLHHGSLPGLPRAGKYFMRMLRMLCILPWKRPNSLLRLLTYWRLAMKFRWYQSCARYPEKTKTEVLIRCAEVTLSDPLAQRDVWTHWRVEALADTRWGAYIMGEMLHPVAVFDDQEQAKQYAETTYILEESEYEF